MRLGRPPAGYGHWTLQLLADEMVALEIVDTISHETVRQVLKKTRVAKVAGSVRNRPLMGLLQSPRLSRPSENWGWKGDLNDFCHPRKKTRVANLAEAGNVERR